MSAGARNIWERLVHRVPITVVPVAMLLVTIPTVYLMRLTL